MNIAGYTDYFHDGALINIEHKENQIVLFLESAEMDLADLKDPIQLSERMTIKGKLHINNIESITINKSIFSSFLEMKYDSGSIFDLEIGKNIVEISLAWENFPPKPYVNDFSTIVIKASHIWWENVPDLFDPFW